MLPITDAAGTAMSPDARKNPFLSRVGVGIRADRPHLPPTVRFTVRSETVGGAVFARLWFRTRGCSKDRQGSCTFCNYGGGGRTDPMDMVRSVADGLAEVAALSPRTLLVSPSGSMFDPVEVPPAARREILGLIAGTAVPEVLCETRAETVTDPVLAEWAEALGDRRSHVELGLESADPWVSRWCLNKSLDRADYVAAVERTRAHGVGVITNVVVGTPFLSALHAVEDAVSTIEWALASGSTSVALFPLHVRGWTVLERLWRHERYAPPSLWSLVEVLRRLGPETVDRVTISWHRDYDADLAPEADDPTRVLASPTTCELCAPAVLDVLDAFRAGAGWPAVEALDAVRCRCHDEWRRSLLEASGRDDVVRRVVAGYEALGREVLGDAWWARHGAEAVADLGAGPRM